ncbi:Uu.00g004070.m01.CDS01 [Anthostomella pinea]|uniref:Uu.00g004070.m01.CDS01 n=1 Tax=Anthostomella pinea TaxID=933095 RepID=A0AAI8VKH4_9PEZI|nr:Uu.00g004070.m01.CDS01 [Anthostomella pinea]
MTQQTDDFAIGENLVKFLAQLLTKCGATPVLWGDCALTVHGGPSIIGVIAPLIDSPHFTLRTIDQRIEFIVEDDKLPGAVAALKESGLSPCADPRLCYVSGVSVEPPFPALHMHIGMSGVYVILWPHSTILWSFPSPSHINLECKQDDPHASLRYVLASDTSVLPGPRLGRGRGAFSKDGGHVVVPSASTMLEAYIRLTSAYRGQTDTFYLSMITYVEEYIDADGLLDDTLLSEPCRAFWRGLKNGQRGVRELVDELQLSLGDGDNDTGSSDDSELAADLSTGWK